MSYIADETNLTLATNYITWLNFIIAIVGAVSAGLTFVLMNALDREIKSINDEAADAQNTRSCI